MADQVMIQIRFKEKTEVGEFNDALYFDLSTYGNMTQADVDALKQARVTNWVNSVKNPPAYVEPTKTELLGQKAELETQLANVNTKLLTAKDVGK